MPKKVSNSCQNASIIPEFYSSNHYAQNYAGINTASLLYLPIKCMYITAAILSV